MWSDILKRKDGISFEDGYGRPVSLHDLDDVGERFILG
jgi:hypothetical protein